MKLKLALIATALTGSMLIPAAATSPASARTVLLQPQGGAPQVAPGWNGNRGGWNRGGYNRGYRGGYYGGRRGGYGWGPAAGAFGAGVLLGGALAAPPPPVYYTEPAPAYDADVAYCMQRFKSYDVRSGTYLGYDGLRHACP